MKLKIIMASTRPSRRGPVVANWFEEFARKNSGFSIELLDLKKIDLPLMDEENHPVLQKYTKAHTKKWSKTIDESDAFILVTPEYNYGYPATLKNAFDYLHREWQEKPVGFVSYGGISAGTRSVQAIKLFVTTLNMMPISQAVNIPFFEKFIEADVFKPNEVTQNAAKLMLDKLSNWAEALKGMREKNSPA